MVEINEMVNAERRAILDELEGLDDDDWAAATVCDPWTVRQLVVHMTVVGNSNTFSFFGGLLRSGFNFDRFTSRDVKTNDSGSNADVLAAFAATVESAKGPPGPKYILLGEIMCHGEDISRSLGRRGKHPDQHLSTLGTMYRTAPMPIGGRKRSKGLRLTATDIEWSAGDGPEVSGPAIDLILAMAGRSDALDDCTGEGVARLRSRC